MIITSSDLPGLPLLTAQVAVVGAGPAGIVAALELAGQGIDVLLIESGDIAYSGRAQALSDASRWDERLHAPMSIATRRQVGGASVIWGGRCVPYDRADFVPRPSAGNLQWPVMFEDLEPYFQRACDWFQCGEAEFDATKIPEIPDSIVPRLATPTR